MSQILKTIASFSGIGWGTLILYSLWWIVTAGTVIYIVATLLNTSLGGWINASGWRQLYLLGGALTLFTCLIRFGPLICRELFRLLARSPMEAVIAIVVLGCIPIIAIPLITAGWPLVWWVVWESVKTRRGTNSTDAA